VDRDPGNPDNYPNARLRDEGKEVIPVQNPKWSVIGMLGERERERERFRKSIEL
jgi:hypothetical protein